MPTQYGLITGGGLNLREQASASSTRLIQIPNNTTIAIVDYNDDWYSTSYGTYAGYVLKQYVTALKISSDVVQQGTVTGGGLNLRRTASTSADVLIQIPNATQIEATDYAAEGAWYRTNYGGYAGYVMKQYITLIVPPVSEWRYGRVTSSALNVRKAPSTSAALWNNVWPLNRIALIKPSETGWYETLYRGEAAYVSANFIEPLAAPVPDSIVARMLTIAVPELGRSNSVYFNGYTGEWCHRFADWLAMHAAQPKTLIPNTSNCGAGIVWFVNDAQKALALEFVKYMTSDEVQTKIFLNVGANPCNADVDIEALAESSGNAGAKVLAKACAMANAADIIVPTVSGAWGGDVDTIINNKLIECTVGGVDIDQKLMELVNELTAIIE